MSSVPAVCVLKGIHVLVVEDAANVASALKTVLEQMSMHVMGPTATTAEARYLVAAQVPKLALVDVNLGQESASGLIDDLHDKGVLVVVISGYAAPPVAMKKVAAFVQKPFNGNELVTTLVAVAQRLR